MRRWSGVLVLAAAAAFGGCGQSNQAKAPVQAAAVQVPAGTELVARLNHSIGTKVSSAGEPFTATLVSPMRDSAGALIASPGATLRGHVVSVNEGGSKSVRLRFDSFQSKKGTYALHATLKNPSNPNSSFQAQEIYAPNLSYSAVLFPHPKGTAVGGGPVEEAKGREAARAQDVLVPKGAAIHLILTQPVPVQHQHQQQRR